MTALYEEAGIFFAYDGAEWIKCDSKSDALGKLSLAGKEENVIYVWPYQRDYAYLGDDTPPDYTIDDDEEALVKIVTLKLDSTKLDQVFFAKDGRNDNSGKESIDVIFWKDDSGIQSYWYTDSNDNTDKFKINDYYTYRIASKQGVIINELKWIEEGTNYPCNSKNDVQAYIFSTANAQKERFVFAAQIETDEVEQAEYATISKPLFKGLFNSRTTDVTQIEFENKDDAAIKVDDGTSTGSIYAWRKGTEVYWCTDAKKARMPADCSSFFSGNANVEKFNFTGFDVGTITTVNGMFKDAAGLKEVVFSTGFNANALTDTGDMFSGCTNFTTADFTNFYTGELTNVKDMFNGCSTISSVVLTQYFMTGSVTDYSGMFKGCSGAQVIDISDLDISSSNDLNLESMFEGCSNLKNIPIDSMTIKPSSLKNTFKDCVLLENLDLSGWNTSNLTSLEGTFSGCTSLSGIVLTGWDLSKITSLNGTFKGLTNLETVEIGTWNLAACTDLSETFAGCTSLTSFDTSKISTSSKLRLMKGTFSGCENLTAIDVSNFNTSSVTDMSSLFRNCSNLSSINGLNKIKTAAVTNMSYMFAGADSLKVLDLTSFNTKNVSDFSGMFFGTQGQNSLITIKASIRFTVKDSCMTQDMFANNTNLKGGAGCAFSSEHVKADYAWIDGFRRKEGYFTGVFADITIDKNHFKTLFSQKDSSGNYILINGVEHVDTDSYTKDQILAMPDAVRVDDQRNAQFAAYAWNDNNTIKWWSDADRVFLPADCSSFFSDFNLATFSFEGFETERITNMSKMFYHNHNLTAIDFGEYFYATGVVSLQQTFEECTSFTSIDLSKWELEKCKNMYGTFSKCSNLEFTFPDTMNLNSCTNLRAAFEECDKVTSDFSFMHTTDSLVNMRWMFKGIDGITTLDLRGFDMSKVEELSSTFRECKNLESITFPAGNFTRLKNMDYTFYECDKLTSLDLSSWAPSTMVNMDYCFNNCDLLEEVSLAGWKNPNLTNMRSTFAGCTNLKTINFTGWESPGLKYLYYTFFNCSSLENLVFKGVGFIQNSDNNDLNQTFSGCTSLQTLDLSGWDVKYVKNMYEMFDNCTSLTSLDITGWAPENVTNLEYTFRNCNSLTSLDMSGWNMAKVKNAHHTFRLCTSLTQITLGDGWYFEACTNGLKSTFEDCSSLDQDFHEMRTSDKITTIEYLFKGCKSLTVLDLTGFDFTNVTGMNQTFNNCSELTTIYTTGDIVKTNNNIEMFTNCGNLSGGNNTAYSGITNNNRNRSLYAKIDNDTQKGYLTYKERN